MSNSLEFVLKQCVTLAESINIIIANGEPPKDKYLYELLKQANCIVCCDGAITTLEQNNIMPNYIVGDLDSLSLAQKEKYSAKIKHFPDQNFNDLTKAVEFMINDLCFDNIIILGATGLREDHSLANICLLVEDAQKSKNIILLSDYGFFRVDTGKAIISTVPKQQISLFAVNPKTTVSTFGLKWDLKDLVLDSWYKGTLNQAQSKAFELIVTQPVLVYQV
ncbi:MAG: thiamine diphosphokinase, partial [Burkholderiales bacterium]|nr:thiamine diphosphokinase [Burkholderiales bacterium]